MNETYNHKVNINKELSSIRLDKILTKKLVEIFSHANQNVN